MRGTIDETGASLMTWGLIIAGILMLATAFLPRLKTGQRVTGIIFGILFIGYGIYVSLPSTRSVYVGIYLFIVPVVMLITNISASVKGNKTVEVQNHGPAGYYPPQGQQPYQGQNQQSAAQAPYGQQYPAQPGQPTEPSQTGYGQPATAQPYQAQPYPAQPVQPNQPAQPVQPNQPVQPGQPAQPNQYQQPTDPTA
ncbi:hypothetical protein UM93_16750 [Psychromicrobium lacuslunae]|uniref:Uncharacterized protein n=2 Tax=Psychromicrobium lacuslunae TaxID=1618207 RepID=A0A0D4C287_9MICC|nr:hypothetical protein UM93_16750 [Psychromicrobium lacuslunae]